MGSPATFFVMAHNRELTNTRDANDRFFSIELESKTSLKNATLASSENQRVLVEGTIGGLQSAEFVDGVVLEVVGSKGVVRINLTQSEICKAATSLKGESK